MKLTQHMLAMQWREAGICEGDMVLIHSSLRRTLANSDGLTPTDILHSFLEAVGEFGTIILPLFNYGFARGETFDILHTPSEMGALTEAARKHPLATRTGHPIYSFAFIGHQQCTVNNYSGYGQDSPFGILHKNRGKIAVLDLDDKGAMTYYHYVEEAMHVPYRYHKTFTGLYTDCSGKQEERTYGLFVRHLKQGILTEVNPMGGLLWSQNVWRGFHPYEGCGLRVGSAANIFNSTAEVILDGKAEGLLYQVKNPAEYIRSMASG